MTEGLTAMLGVTAPLIGFALALIFFRKKHDIAAAVSVFSGLISFFCMTGLLLTHGSEATTHVARWFTIGDVELTFGILLDGKTLIMGAVVALVTSCIQIYSLSYMAHDASKARFFAFLAFFEWSMLSLVYAANLLQLFIFWELVGLASFFLIGFWYEKPSAVRAAKKAFMMTRIGDVGLFIGLVLLFMATGSLDVLGINATFDAAGLPATIDKDRVEWIAMLLFVGVIGKSAQFPLHTWLPDAMEGPTPVSALLHSATMVAAGVFLVTRFHGVFHDAETTRVWMLAIATFTALLASTMAMVAKDMKRVLAFSSISQLGFMLIGLAAGSLFAGYFHLITHAFFKALLFLCAGSFIHALGTNDMIAMGRAGARNLRITSIGLVVGGAALAGIPPLAGFFSKEQILGAMHEGWQTGFKIAAMGAAFLTAYYTFRMVFLLLRPDANSRAVADEPAGAQHGGHGHDAHATDAHGADAHGHDAHGEPLVIRAPIAILAFFALIAGFFGDSIGHAIGIEHIHHPGFGEMLPAIGIALLGVALAWFDYGRSGAKQVGFLALVPPLETFFAKRWYLDELYHYLFVTPAIWIARLCFGAETRGFDKSADAVGTGVIAAGGSVARSHNGRLQLYVALAVLLIAGLTLWVGFEVSGGAR
ncbi:MAG: NADH-quinone oxidoreductase subunit L [Planctomycetes bacterium]|nr:NADH-quinone oxidoreductase subunit L [Planctomycetota bacterium]